MVSYVISTGVDDDDDLYCHLIVTFIIRLVQEATLTTWDLLLLTMYYNEIYNVSILVTLMSRSSLNYPTSVGVGGSIILILLARKYMECGS